MDEELKYPNQYKYRNSEKGRKTLQAWYVKNREYIREQRKNYYQNNKDKTLERNRLNYYRKKQEKKINPALSLLKGAKGRATKNNLPFDITIEDIIVPAVCPVFGIPIVVSDKIKTDNSPSLDRIIPSLGYVKGNVQVISWKANRLKNNATLGELQQLVSYLENWTY